MTKNSPQTLKKIAIIGPSGAGKTTIAAGLFYFLKTKRKKAEIIPELVKFKVYENVDFSQTGFDIANTLEQQKLEETVEKAKSIEYLICEAPLCNGFFYSSFYKKKNEWPTLKTIALKKINTYDLVIFVEHILEEEYETFGRKEDRKTSLKLQRHIKNKFKKELNYKHEVLFVNQQTDIISILNKVLSLT